ncbi:MAG: DUF1211 domain-containing protein [Ktedonobacteraceae bacterium]|nr:DUF1211 domain-containing protein [Ktedonobacteraceae bacterium]MBO0789971.1 DUF1211 domain-containing protein [Ktedonobacteraceae bacterium]
MDTPEKSHKAQIMNALENSRRAWIIEEKTPAFERLIMLCDGVFAIAMTLLVLDVRLPEGVKDFSAALQELLSKGIICLVTFAVIAGYWIGHRHLMSLVKRQDGIFTWLTFLYLAFVVFFPVAFSVVVGSGDHPEAVIFYALELAGCGFSAFLLWIYAAWKHRLVDADLDQYLIISRSVSLLAVPIFFCLSLLLLFVLANPSDMFYSWLLLVVISPAVRRLGNWLATRLSSSHQPAQIAQNSNQPTTIE